MKLNNFGWNEKWESQFEKAKKAYQNPKQLKPMEAARVTAVFADRYRIQTKGGEKEAQVSGKMIFENLYAAKNPTVGDWVVVDYNENGPSVIKEVLPRLSCLQRQEADGIDAQVIGANVDLCILVQSVIGDFSIARLDRYIAMVWDAGSVPMVILSKTDLATEEDVREKVNSLEAAFPGVDILAVSAITQIGIASLWSYLEPSKTYMVLGSSGVGKSTLLNLLMGEEMMKTAEVREEDQKGRHTTTHRQMFTLKNGALYIDTPGMWEVGLFNYQGVDKAFKDVETLAKHCKFADCKHQQEPGCAVAEAMEAGSLTEDRWESYLKLKAEEKIHRRKQILLQKKVAKKKIKRQKNHYKDYKRGGGKEEKELNQWCCR